MSIEQKQVDATNEHLSKETNLVEAAADLKNMKVKWVEIEHGDTKEGDYVFHFTDWHQQRTFPQGDKAQHLVWNIIAEELNKVIPGKEIIAIGSPDGWDKALYTVKVKKFQSSDFDFDDDRIEKAIHNAAEKVSEVIEKTVVRRKF